MKKILYVLGSAIFAIYLVSTSLMTVKETEFVIVSQFGKVVREIDRSGLYIKWPDPIQTITRFDNRLQLLNMDPMEIGTRDRRNLILENIILWKISAPRRYRASVRLNDVAEQRLESLVYSEVGAVIGAALLDDIFSESNDSNLERLYKEITTKVSRMSEEELGIKIEAVRPSRTSFPQQNLLPIYKRMESEWTRRAKQLRAEGQEQAAKIRAETEKEVRELEAKAYKESQIVLGEAEAKAARLYAQAFESNQDYYAFTRKMDAYKKLFGKNTKIILSTDNPVVSDLFEPPTGNDREQKRVNK